MTHYTVKQLATLSNISTRTLRYYDEIGLFQPAFIGENQYRYYTKRQLVDLQQILFFKALGLSLSEIKQMLAHTDYDQIDILVNNRNKLIEKVRTLQALVKTCQNTIQHCRGNILMTDKELFSGFDIEKQQAYEDHLIARGLSHDEIDNSWRKVTKRSKEENDVLHQECRDITQSLTELLVAGFEPESGEVQDKIYQHYIWVCNYWTPNRETYKGLADLYFENNEFNEFYSSFHPEMIEFICSAIRYYAENRLSE